MSNPQATAAARNVVSSFDLLDNCALNRLLVRLTDGLGNQSKGVLKMLPIGSGECVEKLLDLKWRAECGQCLELRLSGYQLDVRGSLSIWD